MDEFIASNGGLVMLVITTFVSFFAIDVQKEGQNESIPAHNRLLTRCNLYIYARFLRFFVCVFVL
jgi:hypothetical protein